MKYSGLTGKVVLPGEPGYEQARQEYNKAVNEYPTAIVYCFEARDVKNAILWSREHGVALRIRSGGHNYEGYSSGTHKLVIDTTFLNRVKVNSADDTAEVQAGVRLRYLYDRLYKNGYTFPGGTCPSVAISGLVLGGGIGLSTRYLGLTADSLVEAEMIDARGHILTANNDCHSELFWALRGGGGGNFGVTTQYKFRLKAVDKITLIQLRWDDNKPARKEFLRNWQEWLCHLDRRMSAFGGIYKRGAWLNAFFYGRPERARQILEPFLNIPGMTVKIIAYVDFIDAVARIGAAYPPREAFRATGRFVHKPFSQPELMELIKIIDKAPGERESTIRVYSLGGAVSEVAVNDTAFFYRQAHYIMAITSSWMEERQAPAHEEWVAAGFKYLYTITQGSYINFPYSHLPDYERAYYGGHVQRLQAIKREYDPHNVFHFPQSIKLI